VPNRATFFTDIDLKTFFRRKDYGLLKYILVVK
jgi:hypothetical protein